MLSSRFGSLAELNSFVGISLETPQVGRGKEEERRARLENDAATKWLSLAMEMDEERKARLEKMLATKRLRLGMETDEERKTRLEKMVAATQLKLAWRQRKKEEQKMDLDLIWIETEVLKTEGRSSLAL